MSCKETGGMRSATAHWKRGKCDKPKVEKIETWGVRVPLESLPLQTRIYEVNGMWSHIEPMPGQPHRTGTYIGDGMVVVLE